MNNTASAKTEYHALYLCISPPIYGLMVWGGTTLGNLQWAPSLQKRATQMLANLQTSDSCRQAFREFKILTVNTIDCHPHTSYIP